MGTTLSGGQFYGEVQVRQEQYDVIFTDLRHRHGRKLPTHSHELAFFALLLDGNYRERYGRKQTDFRPFSLSFRPAGFSHRDEVGPHGMRFFEIELRPSWQKRLQECPGNLDVPHDDCTGGELLWLGMKLFRETRGPVLAGDLNIESLLSELLGVVGCKSRERTKEAPSWMARVIEKVRSDYCERLTLCDLSMVAGVHPVHLSRVFRRCMGEGIGEYVHRLRIGWACEHMLSPQANLAVIAAETGFADQSHFTRAFGKVTGMSPGAFRALVDPRKTESVQITSPLPKPAHLRSIGR